MARSFYDSSENKRVTEVVENPNRASLLRELPDSPKHCHGKGMNRSAVLHDSEAMHRVRLAAEEKLTMALKYVFGLYNKWEGGVNSSRMDKMRFHKVFRCVHIRTITHFAAPVVQNACERECLAATDCCPSAAGAFLATQSCLALALAWYQHFHWQLNHAGHLTSSAIVPRSQ
jgi:hypothetical protein